MILTNLITMNFITMEREKKRAYFRRRFSRIEKLNKKYECRERSF